MQNIWTADGRIGVRGGKPQNEHMFILRNPDWHVMYDSDPVQAAATRRKFYDMAVAEKALIAGFHFPFPALGHVEKDGSGYRLVPVTWSAVL